MLAGLLAFLSSLRRNRRLLKDLVRRDLRARYVGSSMGFFWSVIFPLINLCVYMFVFRLVLKMRWSDQQGATEVALLMLAGIMVWQAFAESTHRMTNTLVENGNLIEKVVFPSEVLPVYLTISSIMNMLIGLAVALAGVAWVAYVKPDDGAARPPPQPVAFGAHAPGERSAAPELTSGSPFRCASAPQTTRYTADSVVDDARPAWTAAALGSDGGAFAFAGFGDRVYAASGEWAHATGKKGVVLRIDRWRDRAGREVPPPQDGVQALVVGEPEKRLGLSASLAALPLLLLLQGTFMLGLGCLLAPLNLYVRDAIHLVAVGMTAWMFATPIFYPERMVQDAGYGWLPEWNPMHWLIACYRSVLVYGDWPDPTLLLRFGLVGAGLLVVGTAFFMAQKPRFPDLL